MSESDPIDLRRAVPPELAALALAWVRGDPDPQTADQLTTMLDTGDELLADHVGSRLTFGTAGLRGVVGPGPNRMNRAVVIRTTAGLGRYLLSSVPDAATRGVIVGFDARHDSERFARDVVGVLTAAGIAVRWFPTPQPTPLVAYAQKALDAAAAVVITASHNPAEYNGYKVYAEGAAQIVPPTDLAIAAAIETVEAASDVPREDPLRSERVTPLGEEVIGHYLTEIRARLPASAGPSITVAYTPLHGVGGALARRAMAAAGHRHLAAVDVQAEPDANFPTVAFPNPEEPGALDAVLALGTEIEADLVLANDPDADRLGVAIPEPRGGFRALTGNQIGILLADHLLATAAVERPFVVSSIVSTPMVHAVAASYGAHSEVTLTGFKWISSAARALEDGEGLEFVYGFEEALGSRVGSIVADKDGISAAVAFADLARRIGAQGIPIREHLNRLYRRHGFWVSHQQSVWKGGVRGAAEIAAAMAQLDGRRPASLSGHPVTQTTDFRVGAAARPPWLGAQDLVAFEFPDGRAMIRPSGTEPKVKIYVDLHATIGHDEDPDVLETELMDEAGRIADELTRCAGLA